MGVLEMIFEPVGILVPFTASRERTLVRFFHQNPVVSMDGMILETIGVFIRFTASIHRTDERAFI